MKICIFSDQISDHLEKYSFLQKENPLYQIHSLNPSREKVPFDDYDLFILDEHAAIGDVLVMCMAANITERCILLINGQSCLKTSDIKKAKLYDTFSTPINPIEISLKVSRFFDLSCRSFYQNRIEGLTLKQQRILEVLKFKRTVGVSREVLLSLVWGDQVVVPKNIDVHITEMRRILKDEGYSIIRENGRWFLKTDIPAPSEAFLEMR